jgi:anaerobic ribonucleoside-triphosphate reductase activating protein
MRLHLSKVHYPVTALGPGTRLGIWTQGCTVGCRGCASRDTWEVTPEHEIDVDDLVARCAAMVADGPLDGVTISGGEPSDQPDAVLALVVGIRARARAEGREIDVLLYSGRSFGWLEVERSALLAAVDAVIPEPYLDGRPAGGVWRGSSNQPIVPLSRLGRERYGSVSDDEPPTVPFQLAVDDGSVWFIGIPRRGDLDRIVERAARRGVVIEEASWRS